MAIVPRTTAQLDQLHVWMKKIADLLDTERVPAREMLDVHANMLMLGLVQRRAEDEPAALETIDLIIDKLTAMKQMPDVTSMVRYLRLTSVKATDV